MSVVQVICAAIGWACLGTFVLLLSPDVSPLAISAVRGFWIVAAFALMARRSGMSIVMSPRVVTAGMAYGFSALTYIASLRLLPVAVAAPLHYTSPIFLIAAHLLAARRMPARAETIGLTCTAVGAIILCETAAGIPMIGVALAIASAALWAGYLGLQGRFSAEERNSAAFFGGITLILIGTGDIGTHCFTPDNMMVFALLGICSSILPLILLARASQFVPATASALILLSEPVFATLIAYVVNDQVPSFRNIIGLVIVLCGALSGTAVLCGAVKNRGNLPVPENSGVGALAAVES